MEDFDFVATRRKLKRWFAAHARPLPWRLSRDPYQIWISEIMLQQTTVKAVVPYYERFLKRFPRIEALAAATEAEVLQHWEGLGYYSRGRNLHKAARKVVTEHGGTVPTELAALQTLPGIGRYTAGAIRSFAFDLPGPIVEANTLRLYSRLLCYHGDPRSREGQQLLWEFATRLQPQRGAGAVNQAAMELGATLCTPAAPDCQACPLFVECGARQHEIPPRQNRAAATRIVDATIAIRSGAAYLLRQRNPEERWAGLWDFPRVTIQSVMPEDRLTPRRLRRATEELQHHLAANSLENLIDSDAVELVTELQHTVTRYRIRLLCLQTESACRPVAVQRNGTPPVPPPGPEGSDSKLRWVTLREMAALPMPVTGRKFADRLAGMTEE